MLSSAPRTVPSFRILSTVLVFIFAGAIVGETAALSMVVSVAGSQIISKLYLANGFLLLLLPPLFFSNIDRVNRSRLLSFLLLFTSGILVVVFVALRIGGSAGIRGTSILLWAIYPLAYLSKTVLFLTFWTLANDVCPRGEAKQAFPQVAAWGFVGALGGALVARALLELVEAEAIIVVWAAAYLAAYVFSRRITRMYRARLLQKEQVVEGGTVQLVGVLGEVRDVLAIDLVRLISVLYFLVFVAVFALDYFFWHTCHIWFTTSRTLASFQFTFYLTHGFVTIVGLRLVMPSLISRWGFPRIFAFLPYTLFAGSLCLVVLGASPAGVTAAFLGLIALQFARHVSFENSFSPVYQMFFASISKEKRGRAKTILEGVIKPAAIMVAGLTIIAFQSAPKGILAVVAVVSGLMVWVVRKVRLTYMRGLVPQLYSGDEPSAIIAEIGSHYDLKILSLIKEYSRSEDADLRAVAVKILAQLGSREALSIVAQIYRREKQESVKEMVARSLTNFYWHEAKGLVEALLRDPNPRTRGNAVYSLNEMNCHWKWRLRDTVKSMLFDTSIRVRNEAARYLWQTGGRAERATVQAYLSSLLKSRNAGKRSAGLYLAGVLKGEGWEKVLLDNLTSGSFQVYSRSIDVIFGSATAVAQLAALWTAQVLSREHVAYVGRAIQRAGLPVKDTVVVFLREAKNRRLVFELVHALRHIRDAAGRSIRGRFLDEATEQALTQWTSGELENAYRDGFVWFSFRSRSGGVTRESWTLMLDDALHERILRIGEWALDTLALLGHEGGIAWSKRDLDINDYADRMDMVEVLENYGPDKLSELIVPIVRGDAWETIAKVGRQHFGFDEALAERGLRHFVHAENKWVCVCALYCLSRLPHLKEFVISDRETLAALATDSFVYLSRAARQLLNPSQFGGGSMPDTFELLETVLFFKKTLLFRNVPAEKLMGLAEISRLVSHKRETVISREGDISDHLYVVKSGSLKIVKVKNTVRTILSIVRAGESYGEIGLLNQAPRSASAVANEDCQLYVIQRSSLKKLLLEMPEIAYNFLEIFSEKLRRSGEEVALLQTALSGKIVQEAVSAGS